MISRGTIHCGDNIQFMRSLPSKSIDLIYIDPPYFTQKNFGDFDDRWESLGRFVIYLTLRIYQCRRLLKDTGVFCLHLDWRSVHYLKVKCDEIFGYNNFVNEIIWEFSTAGQAGKTYKKCHNTILVYSKGKKFTCNAERGSLAETTLNRFKNAFDKNGNITIGSLMQKCPGTYRRYLRSKRVKDSDPHDKIIMSLKRGAPLKDCWHDLKNQSFRGGGSRLKKYETQKPLPLLERIVKSFSKEGDTVADFFCGSGTTLVAAKKLGRKYIGCDISKKAVKISKERLL